MLANYFCIFATEERKEGHILTFGLSVLTGLSQVGRLDLLIEDERLQSDERDHGVAQRLAEGTQVLAVLQVDDQLGVESIPGLILDRLKIPAN